MQTRDGIQMGARQQAICSQSTEMIGAGSDALDQQKA
jgi:hypothetical protein